MGDYHILRLGTCVCVCVPAYVCVCVPRGKRVVAVSLSVSLNRVSRGCQISKI